MALGRLCTDTLELATRLGQLRRGSRALNLELIDPVRCNRPATQLRQLAVSTIQLGARLHERRLVDRALAYERSDPGIERFELRVRRRRFGHRLGPRLLEFGARLRQCRSGRFELVRPYLQ